MDSSVPSTIAPELEVAAGAVTPVDATPEAGGEAPGYRLFGRLRTRLLRNAYGVLRRDTPVRLVSIVLCSLVVWAGIFAVSHEGFTLLRQKLALLGPVVNLIFDLLFLALAMLLVFSTGIILYSGLFASAEAKFLLSTPAPADQVFAYQFQGAVAVSSWAFLLLGSPVLLSFGLIMHAPLYYYALLPLFFLGFVLVPGSLGAMACLVVANCFPRRPRQLIVLLLVSAVWIGRLIFLSAREQLGAPDGVQRLLGQFAFARSALFPTHWMGHGLQAAANGRLDEVAYYLALIWSNGLFLYLLTTWCAARFYRRGFDRLATGGMQRRRYRGTLLDRAVTAAVGFLQPQIRLLIVKDFRTFRRDPAQWLQIVIFTGLLTLYFRNVRSLYREEFSVVYQFGISLLNLTATTLLLCAYTSRFIFPMLSLEGKKFWILGLLPFRRERLLWGKFAFSATGGLVIATLLVVLSDVMLGMPTLATGLHVLIIALATIGLSGLSVGLGACMPNFTESDPSKIAVGTGGTLNLVVGLLFVVVLLCSMAVPWHLRVAMASATPELAEVAAHDGWGWVTFGVIAGVPIGIATAFVPLWLGGRALRRMEF